MGKKNVASSKAAAKAAKKAKQEKKTEKKEVKNKTKGKDKDGEPDDDQDLESILDTMRKEWELAHRVTEETVEGPPSRRANATLTACPNGNHLWSVGGEYFSEDGKAHFYNDVYRYTPEKDEWRKFTSPTCPGPRSAHATVATSAGGGQLFLFGGEFSSLHQTTFHHYRDFWSFDIMSRMWERIDTKIKPSARSGHRMAIWKNFVVLFGGFYDPGIRTTYLNDLWLFDLQEYKWQQVPFKETERKPSPRSGFSFLPVADGVVLHGGYCKEYVKGKRPQGIALEDTFLLKMSTEPKEIKWERRKKAGYAPSIRSGCTMTLWAAKEMGILFGGVRDEDTSEEVMTSEFFNDLYGYQAAGNGRWNSLQVKKKKKSGGGNKKAKSAKVVAAPTSWQDEEDELIPGESSDEDGHTAQKKLPPQVVAPIPQEPLQIDPDEPILPAPRYNSMLAVLRNTLYIYGGILERGSREHTLDDFWSIQLDKMDGYVCLKPLLIDIMDGGEESSSDDDGEDDDEEEDDEMDEDGEEQMVEQNIEEDVADDEEVKNAEAAKRREASDQAQKLELRSRATAFLESSNKAEARTAADILGTPLPGESLATYYARSREHWAQVAHESSDNRGKMLRRDGFALAEERYASYKPILEEVEKILAEAGLDAEEMKRVGAGGGVGAAAGSRNRR